MMATEPKTLQDIIDQHKKSIDDASPQEWSAAVNVNYMTQYPPQKTEKTYDEVNKPAHYNYGKYETIDVIVDTLGEYDAISYCHGNVLKYTIRMWHKGTPEKDAAKAKWYLEKMIELLGKTKGLHW